MSFAQGFLEAALQKSDADLFKELFRVYPLAVVDDYYKAGWQNALMQMDLQLFLAHLEESGAPEPPPLDQLTLPALPEPGKIFMSEGVKPREERAILVTPVLPHTETLQILVFANKHRLDLTKAKQLLAPLDLAVREPVMSDFKPGEDGSVLAQLQDFMEKSGVSFQRIDDEQVVTPLASTEAGTEGTDASPAASEASPASASGPVTVPAKIPPKVPPLFSTPKVVPGAKVAAVASVADGPRPAGPLRPGLVVPKVVPAKAPVKAPPVKTPPVKTPPAKLLGPRPPNTVPPKHLLLAAAKPGPVSKPMPTVLAAKLPTKRPLEAQTEAEAKRPKSIPQIVPQIVPKVPHVVKAKVFSSLPPRFPMPSLPWSPWW